MGTSKNICWLDTWLLQIARHVSLYISNPLQHPYSTLSEDKGANLPSNYRTHSKRPRGVIVRHVCGYQVDLMCDFVSSQHVSGGSSDLGLAKVGSGEVLSCSDFCLWPRSGWHLGLWGGPWWTAGAIKPASLDIWPSALQETASDEAVRSGWKTALCLSAIVRL